MHPDFIEAQPRWIVTCHAGDHRDHTPLNHGQVHDLQPPIGGGGMYKQSSRLM